MNNIYERVYLTNSGIALKGFLLIKESVFENVPIFHFYKYALFKRVVEPKIIIGGNNNLIIHNHWSAGYHHWLTEAMVRLISIDSTKYNLIIPSDYPTFAFDMLSTFNFRSTIKLPIRTGAYVSNITIPSNPKSGFYKKEELQAIKNHFHSHYNIGKQEQSSRIYVTRKNASKRKIENEDELLPILDHFGFEVIDADNLTFLDQIKIFTSCNVLISIHGAALTNCIFMSSKTHLIELYKANTFINHCYERMTKELGINFIRILCDGGKNDKTHVDITDLVVNINKFVEILNKFKR